MARGTNNLKGPGPGRPKGSKDKINRNVRENIMEVWAQLEKDGKGLYETAQEQGPAWFFTNFIKGMLPKDVVVQGDSDNPVITEIVVKHVKPGTGTAGKDS